MHVQNRSHVAVAATGMAAVGIVAMATAQLAPPAHIEPLPAVAHDVRLAATQVPPGGLLTSFLSNQVVYCSFICPPLINTGVTAAVSSLNAPVAFITGLQSGNVLKAVGAAAASVTGPTNTALKAAIDADTTFAVPKASNAFEVAVIGLLNVPPAAAGGLPAVAAAIETAREQTFEALNLPVPVTDPDPSAMPNGVVQVAALGAIRVGEAVIFPAFNDVLQATVAVPNAAAQELAASGDPARAAVAGVTAAAAATGAAANTVGNAVVAAVNDVRAASGQSARGTGLAQVHRSSATTTSAPFKATPQRRLTTIANNSSEGPGNSHPLRDMASKAREAVRHVVKNVSDRPHRAGKDRG
jgi:hypothetical protein